MPAISKGCGSCARMMPSASVASRSDHALMPTLFDAARECLDAAGVDEKIALTRRHAAAFAAGGLAVADDAPAPAPIRMPGRPPRPAMVHPRDLPRRGLGSIEGRAAFIHS